jgi:hypothetical protein
MAFSQNIPQVPDPLSNSLAFFAPGTNHTPGKGGIRFIVQPCVPRVTQVAKLDPQFPSFSLSADDQICQ